MRIETINQLLASTMAAVDEAIIGQFNSDVALINDIGYHITQAGGKRLRPKLALLSALALGYAGEQHIDLAAVVELIHTATLLHDDVVDESAQRRGRPTANAIWSNQASVLVGDYIYTRAFQMMVAIQQLRVLDVMANTTNTIAEGEVLQLMNCNDPSTDEQRYMDVIHRKTAVLFRAAAQLGAIVAEADAATETALANYGLAIGTAFQLVDDALDYTGDAEALGKSLGDDLAEGKPTLPLIYAMQHGTSQQQQLIKTAIENGDREQLTAINEAIQATGAIHYTLGKAKQFAAQAANELQVLKVSEYRDCLQQLADYVLERDY